MVYIVKTNKTKKNWKEVQKNKAFFEKIWFKISNFSHIKKYFWIIIYFQPVMWVVESKNN